jgi:hypothetical protein
MKHILKLIFFSLIVFIFLGIFGIVSIWNWKQHKEMKKLIQLYGEFLSEIKQIFFPKVGPQRF